MNSSWPEVPFEDLLLETKDGEWGDASSGVGLREVLIIRGTDFESIDNPSAEFPQRWVKDHLVERKQLQAGDIILETAGGTSSQSTGRSVLLKSSFFDQHSQLPVLCASFSRHLRINREKYDARFISSLLQGLYRFGYMGVFNIQHTGVSRFQFTDFKNHTKLRIPEKPTQQKIAAVLAGYDDLIEANRRRIALLERMAEEIYREWFVRLRFPAYQKTPFSKGLPTDWSQQRVGQLVDRLGFGRIYREAELARTGAVVVIDQSTAEFLGFYDGEPQHEASIDAPILLFGDHTCKMCFMTKQFSLAENVIPFRPIPGLSAYFLFHLIRGLAETTEYKRHWSELTNRPVLRPTAALSDLFEEQVRPLHVQVDLLVDCNQTLQRTRDLLLPRLISGKLPIEDLAIAFPPSMVASS